jgi:hypothetical protein
VLIYNLPKRATSQPHYDMISEAKKSNISRRRKEYSEALERVDLSLLQYYIKTGKGNFPDELVVYLELLELVRSMYSKYETKNFIITTLTNEVYGISRHKATELFHDALNFFYSDNQVKQKAWENIYANHLDNLAYLALEKDDIETARKCFLDAAKLRGVGSEQNREIPKELLSKPVIIYTLDPSDVGLPKASKKELAEFIDNLPEISERERVRLSKDAGITEVTIFDDEKAS